MRWEKTVASFGASVSSIILPLFQFLNVLSPKQDTATTMTISHRKWPQAPRHLVVDSTGWSIIPAENLVAAFQGTATNVLLWATTASEARTLLGALERGVDGVVLKTDSVQEVGPRGAT
jgi:3-dehydroquinate synthase class II